MGVGATAGPGWNASGRSQCRPEGPNGRMPDGRSPEGTTQTFALFGTQGQFCKPALNYEPTEGPKKPLKSPPVGAAAKDGHDPRSSKAKGALHTGLEREAGGLQCTVWTLKPLGREEGEELEPEGVEVRSGSAL